MTNPPVLHMNGSDMKLDAIVMRKTTFDLVEYSAHGCTFFCFPRKLLN